MKYPKLTELNTSRDMIDVFGGYNHNLRIREGEFYEMENLTSADYPVLSPRHKRGIYTFPTLTANPTCLASKDALCYVDYGEGTSGSGKLYINKSELTGVNLPKKACNQCASREWCPKYIKDSPHCNRTMISMGSYIIIMPDGYYVNTNDYDDKGFMERSFTCSGEGAKATFSLCKLDGSDYNAPAQDNAPTNPKNLDLWIDTSSTPHVLKQYAATTEQWTSVATTYIKIKAIDGNGHNLADSFEVGDGITIKGITNDKLNDLNSTMVIQAKGDDYIVVIGMLDETYEQECFLPDDAAPDALPDIIVFSRSVPEMDFVIEAGNRLWGCRYGINRDGNYVNEIYASKLGDFKNWNCFAGISTDSYAASVGTDGQFTGAITYLGYPIFFKENYIHKVYGNYPANFQIQTTACRGVQKGCSKSLAIVNETLYYKSRSAVCAYDGSLPVEVSSPLGDVAYSDAVAGVLGNKYYISMNDSEDYHLFVYDTAKGMWHREDNTQAVQFCNCRGNLYYIDYADKKIKMIREEAGEDTETEPIKWKAITGVIGTDSPDKKYISSLVVRMKLEVGTTVRFSAEYDSSGEFEHLFTKSGHKLQSFSIPIRPKRCDHLRLKIEGQGEAKIYSICKTIEQGSDV